MTMMVMLLWNTAMCWLSKRWRMEMGWWIGLDGQCKKQRNSVHYTAYGQHQWDTVQCIHCYTLVGHYKVSTILYTIHCTLVVLTVSSRC